MQIINPIWKAAHLSMDPLRARAKHRKEMREEIAATEYLAATHRFEMWHNQQPTAEFRIMTGGEAQAANFQHKLEFTEEIGRVYPARVSVPLKRWRWVERLTPETPTASPQESK